MENDKCPSCKGEKFSPYQNHETTMAICPDCKGEGTIESFFIHAEIEEVKSYSLKQGYDLSKTVAARKELINKIKS